MGVKEGTSGEWGYVLLIVQKPTNCRNGEASCEA